MKHFFLLLLISANFCGISQDIKYLNPAHGNNISKYRFLVSDGIIGQDSLLIGEYKFNRLGFCIEEHQKDILSKIIYSYQNDSILLLSDQYINGSEYPVMQKKYFYDDNNLLIKIREYIFNTTSNSTKFKYNKSRQLTDEIVKLKDRTTQSKTKKRYSENLLTQEERVCMSDQRKKFHFYEYNENKQLESFYYGYEKDERILFKTYEYNDLGKLFKMSQFDCDEHTIKYEYDNLENKILESKFIDSKLVSITKFYYSNIAI